MNWWAANSYCKSGGEKLVEIDFEKENTALVEEINRSGYTGKNFWIGLTDWGTEGTWWLASGGLKATYEKWHVGGPNGGVNQNCARIRIGPNPDWKDTWSDINCEDMYHTKNYMHALCEYSQKPEDPSTEGG